VISRDDNDEPLLASVPAVNKPFIKVEVQRVGEEVVVQDQPAHPIGARLALVDYLIVVNTLFGTDLALSQSMR